MSDRDLAVSELFDFSDTVALITGAGVGIGAATAKRFAEAGAAVAVHYRSSAAGAAEVVEQVTAAGGRAIALQADVTEAAQVDRLVEQTVEELGGLHTVVNNAGIYPVSPLLEMAEDEWDAVVAANLKSVHLLTRAAGRCWVARDLPDGSERGSIVNIASVEGHAPADMHAHYTSTKAGVIMHTRSAALELGKYGIRVNAVAPGLIWKEGLEEAWPDGVARWRAAAPLGRMGLPREIADACLFLASRASRWTTGSTLTVDGGVLSRAVF